MYHNDSSEHGVSLVQDLGRHLVENAQDLPLTPSDVTLMEDLGRQLVALCRGDDMPASAVPGMEELGLSLLHSAQARRAARPRQQEGLRIGSLQISLG